MQFLSLAPTLGLAVLAAAPSAAQSINVCITHPMVPSPPASYGAAAASPGFWSPGIASGTSTSHSPLFDLSGAPTTATLQLPPSGTLSPILNCLTGEDWSLISFFTWTPCGAGPVVFEGLENGGYTVICYAYQQDFWWIENTIEVIGSNEGPQVVGGQSACAAGEVLTEGVTHSRHTVEVTNGRVEIEFCTPPSGFACFNGFQLVRTSPPGIGTSYCSAAPNSTGAASTLTAHGDPAASANDLTLVAAGLPPGEFGIFLTSNVQDFVPGANGTSDGILCLGGTIGRFVGQGQIVSSGPLGTFRLAVDLTTLPQGTGTVAATAGETWNFQAWHRDTTPRGSGFTPGHSIAVH